jgi:2-keto-3-deoxy-L-rhamnonate aldolase RhmA
MGIPGQLLHPELIKAYETAAAACKKHGKWLGMGGVYTDEGQAKYVSIGARMILASSDMTLLINAAAARAETLRKLK